jgi:hypothetical protein
MEVTGRTCSVNSALEKYVGLEFEIHWADICIPYTITSIIFLFFDGGKVLEIERF